MFGLAYDAVKNNLGSVFDALHRGPKTCNNIKTYRSFVHYLTVVGSDGKEERKHCFNCFGKFILKEMCNEGNILYLPLDFKQLCQKAGEELENITIEEVASEVKEGDINIMLHREMSVIFSSGASNNERQKKIPFPADVCIVTRSSDDYPSHQVPNEEDIEKLLPFPSYSEEVWTIETINSEQQMNEILKSSFMTSKILGIDLEADDDHLALMCVTNYDPKRIIYTPLTLSQMESGKCSILYLAKCWRTPVF